jgi:hypothetical protein
MRKALIVGIDYYQYIDKLHGCVNDAYAVKQMLDRHSDGSVNFPQPRLMVGTGPSDIVDRSDLKEAVRHFLLMTMMLLSFILLVMGIWRQLAAIFAPVIARQAMMGYPCRR